MNEVIIRTDFSMEVYEEPKNYIAKFDEKEISAIWDFIDIVGLTGLITIERLENTSIVERG